MAKDTGHTLFEFAGHPCLLQWQIGSQGFFFFFNQILMSSPVYFDSSLSSHAHTSVCYQSHVGQSCALTQVSLPTAFSRIGFNFYRVPFINVFMSDATPKKHLLGPKAFCSLLDTYRL